MLDGKKIAILAEDDFEDSEVSEPLRSMKSAGAKVVIIGSSGQSMYHGKRGNVSITSDAGADEINVDDYDAIIVPGGGAPEKMRLHNSMVELVKKAHEHGKIIAAICHGPQLLISAGIVRWRRVTSWPSVAVDLRNAGAEWADAPVVRDGNIITSRKPADLPRFNKMIIEVLRER